MGNSLSESLLLIRKHLLQISSLTDIVEERIYSHHFYDFDNETTRMPLVIVDYNGGDTNYGMQQQKINIEIYCYSKNSSAESLRLYDIIYNNLHAAQLLNSSITVKGYAYEASRPISNYNNQAKAWLVLGRFSLNLAG